MTKTDLAGAADAVDSAKLDKSSQQGGWGPVLVNGDIARRERAVIDDEAAVVVRENSAMAREGAATLREDAATVREDSATSREDSATSREDSATSREDSATSREDSATSREDSATSREEQIRLAKALQAASDEHMLMLQQANTRLVIATVEAQKLTERLEKAQVELERAKSMAEKASLAKSDFLSNMSHELRTPLNAILGFAQLLECGVPQPTAPQAEKLQQITKAGWYLLDLINEILDLAVIESGKLSLSKEPVSVIDIMRECQAMIEVQAQQHGIQVEFFPFDNNWFVNADRTRVKQIVINLLSNAIKYNRAHGTVEVRCTASGPERIRISVKDSGAGLSSENLAHLFQPFNRLGQEAGAEEGTGIGLVVAKQLIELMGGTIGVQSTVGVGSEFWVELQRDAAPELAVGHPMAAALAPQAPGDAPLRTLLYVEDNPSNLMLVAQILEGHPHLRMLSASDGTLGLSLARAHLPDVILMDINLRGISGFEVFKILREDPLTARIPVLAISANAMRSDIEKGLAAGFLRYITKPIKVSEFMDALNMALQQPQDAGLS